MANKSIKKNNTGKRKLNAKGRNAVRKIAAFLLLITAITIAAIPEDKSGIALAAVDSDLDYDRDGNETDHPENGDFPVDNMAPNGKPERYSFQIIDIDGNQTLYWQYKYFDPAVSANGPCVISKYNDVAEIPVLDLKATICTGFEFVTIDQYNTWVNSNIANKDFTLDMGPYNDSYDGTVKRDTIMKYFPEQYSEYITSYEASLKAYRDAHPETPDFTPLSKDDFDIILSSVNNQTFHGNDMKDELRRQYYCDNNKTPGKGISMANCTLELIYNNCKGFVSDTGKTGETRVIPDDGQIYVVKRLDDKAQDTLRFNKEGYSQCEQVMINGIGDRAFANTERVKRIEVGVGIINIGNEAFTDSFISEVNFAAVNTIGNRIFKDCMYIKEVNISNECKSIGKEAFSGCTQLREIYIPDGVKNIGFGAFSKCPVLQKVDIQPKADITIGEYAFFDCPQLSSVTFPEDYKVSLGKGCFALTPGSGTSASLTTFNFPKNIGTYKSFVNGANEKVYKYDGTTLVDHPQMGDYILANRYNLKEVTMPNNFASSTRIEDVPVNTFAECIDLECVNFGKSTNSEATFEPELFRSVQNDSFYVYGPKLSSYPDSDGNYYAKPRMSTWQSKTAVAEYVPYVYNDGVDHYEVGIGNYRYELSVNNADKTAELLSCKFIKGKEDIDLIIPGKVAAYTITKTAPGCYEEMKPYLHSVTVADDSINEIGDDVFKNCTKMVFVNLGNSIETIGNNSFEGCTNIKDVVIGENITSIGSEAFKGCTSLNDVYFKSPKSTLGSIGGNAFYTESDYLYFHGDIMDGYLPFEYAMGENKINSGSTRICYESLSPRMPSVSGNSPAMVFTDSPQTIKCIMDEESKLVTMIGYPHYEDLPFDVRDAYEHKATLNDEQRALLNNSLYINVPEAIESIDVAKFLDSDSNNPNRTNWIYLEDASNSSDNSSETWKDIYGKSINDSVPGLFSGYMDEATEITAYGDDPLVSQKDIKGNDWILSVEIPGVISLPDNAFDSCERLQSVIIGPALDEIGSAAFRDCDQLTTIGTNGNQKYVFDNFIVYEALPDGSYDLNTCLPARGINKSSNEIWVDSSNDPMLNQVSNISEAAFQNCKSISKVDLSTTNLSKILADTFDGCSKLTDVKLPDTVRNILERAFTNCADALDVTIPCDSNISDNAFSKSANVTLWTYPQCEITANYKPKGYSTLYVKFLDVEYTITFLNDDLTVFEKINVTAGRNGYYPETDPSPKLPNNSGYEFSYWYFDNPNGIKNVNENRQAMAIFAPKNNNSPSNNSSGNNGNNGNNGSNGNNGNSGNNGNNGSNGNNSSNNQSNNSPSNNSASQNKPGYNVIVENGAGSGKYEPGKVVTITAYAPVAGQVFDRWTTSNTDIGFSNAYSVSTTFIMPTHDVKVTATYKLASTSNNSASNNSASNNRPNNTTNNNNNNNNNANTGNNGGGVSGNNTNGNNNNGTEVRVTTDTIDNNNKNLASATVAGSTDNFVVKITDSAQANALIEQALKNKFGNEFGNIKYVAFDISLYDETGTYLIENSNSLAVTITLPIPDELMAYAGNNRVGVAINGQLDEKAVKFTTIDGVPCMTFTATHFSPYTIFVDTGNLSGGTTDETPKTGDGIAPKWFISLGLAGLAGVLFMWKEKKKNPKEELA